jgi:tetratricopeptide (TPR) repeat protein/S1-C subfamily serine protease
MNKNLTIIPLCLLALAGTQIQSMNLATATPSVPKIAAANTMSPAIVARQITVRVLVGDRRSSGTIIARRGNRYTVLTNAHVANKSNNYRITAPDGKTYPAKCAQALKQGVCTADKNHDLALLEFTSSQTYTVPTWGDSRSLTPGETIYSAGFPFDRQAIQINQGKIDTQTTKPLRGGYQIGYGSTTEPGMSGGSLLNAQGQLVGIIGFSSYPILNHGYQYQDGSQPAASEIRELRKSSFAIPIATLAEIDRRYAALLPKNGGAAATVITRKNYTGVVKKVDDIAQQITVRIEDKNGANGSGVIVAREGDTYYVVTAAHVIQETKRDNGRNVLREKMANAVVTPTQEKIALSEADINVVNKDLDIGVIKFKSKQNYRVAEIGRSEFKQSDWVFVSGFPGEDRSKRRQLTIGTVTNQDTKEFVVKNRDEELGSLTKGYNLVYTNLSLPGMSGGAILDRQGRLVGINNGAENEQIIENDRVKQINFGYALGIPISTVMGATSRGQLPTIRSNRANLILPKSTQQEDSEIQQIQLSTLAKPGKTASTEDWLNYANLLWRGNQSREAITAFETAGKLLDRNPELFEREKQLRIAYFGMGLAWFQNSQGSKQDDLRSAVKAFDRAVKIDPSFFESARYLGKSLLLLRRFDEALIAYQRASDKNQQKRDFVLYLERGELFSILKRDSEAANSYNQAINLQPNHPRAYILRGAIYTKQKQYSQAIADFTQAIKLDPNDSWAYAMLGAVYTKQKQYPQAIANFDQAIKFDPQHELAHIGRGIIYSKQKKYPQSIVDFTRAIELDSQSSIAHRSRGNSYRKLKQYSQAIADFTRAIKLDPEYSLAYHDRGLVYKAQEQYPKAIADFTQAIKLDPQDIKSYLNRGIIYSEQQKYPQAIADFTAAIKINPKDTDAYIVRGLVYSGQKKYSQAIADYTAAIKINPRDTNAYTSRAMLYQEQKQYPQAIADFTAAIKINPQDTNAYNGRGILYREQKQYPQAIADFTAAIKINPQEATGYNGRGSIYKEQKQYPQAIADFTAAIKINPQEVTAYYYRGLIYALQNQNAQAQADLEQAASLARAQNNTGGYQKVMAALQKLKDGVKR